MNITIIGRKVTPRESFKQRVESKLSKLDRFFSHDAVSMVTVSQDKDDFTAEITVRSQGMIFRAEKTAPELFDAFEAASDSITKQIVKNKSKLEKKYRPSADYTELGFESEPDESEYKIVKTKRFEIKPMTIDEAVLQMNLLSHAFYMFRNIDSEAINVVYKRKDGNYGLLEPSDE